MNGKEYTQDEIRDKFRNHICIECEGNELTFDVVNGWVSKYKCPDCGINYEFTESDMGQTLPHLESNA